MLCIAIKNEESKKMVGPAILHRVRRVLSKEKTDLLLAYIRNGNVMTVRDKLALIIQLSVPSILAQITQILMFFIDAAMVGHLGAEPSAAIGLVESTTWLLGSLTGAVAVGFSVQVAHAIGENDMRKARRVFRHGLVCALVISLIIVAVGSLCASSLPQWLGGAEEIRHDASLYFLVWVLLMPAFQISNLCGSMLKSSGDMRTQSIGSVMVCFLDVLFNYFFIFILGMGVVGAALGSACAITINMFYQGYFAIFRNKMLALRQDAERFVWNWLYVRKAVKVSAPIAVQSFLLSGAQIVSTMIVAPLGVVAIAANTFAITAESLCYMPGYGLGDAAATLIGQSKGAQRRDLCWSFAKMTVGAGMAVMAFMGVVMYIFAPEMMSLMTPVEEIRDLGAEVLRIEAWAEPMFAAAIVCNSCMVGAGDTLKPMFLNLLTMWCIRLTIAALLASNYGLQGVWFGMAVELSVRGMLFLIRLKRKNWM